MSLGSRLREARESKNLSASAKELSELSGVPEKTIYRIETGEVQDPKPSSINPLMMALHDSTIIFEEDEVFGADELTKSYLQADALPEEDKRTIAEIIRRWSMVGSMETYFPREFLSEVSKSNRHKNGS